MGQTNAKCQAMEARQDPNKYVRFWVEPLSKACFSSGANCGFCCYSLFCPCCASYGLRKRTLHNDMTRYLCCGGSCFISGRCGEQSCPECCLCMETCCCFGMSVATTRFMIQDELKIQTSACDNCIIGFMIALQYLACICHIVACITGSAELQELSQCIDILADVVWCTVCACMQTQHHIELKERDAMLTNNNILPPQQQMIAINSQYPPMPPGSGGNKIAAGHPVQHAPHKPSSYPSTQSAYR